MVVTYKIFDEYRYNECCRTVIESYPDEDLPSIEDFTKTGIGTVIEFIKGGFFSSDKFLICDNVTGEFIKTDIKNCKKIDITSKD